MASKRCVEVIGDEEICDRICPGFSDFARQLAEIAEEQAAEREQAAEVEAAEECEQDYESDYCEDYDETSYECFELDDIEGMPDEFYE